MQRAAGAGHPLCSLLTFFKKHDSRCCSDFEIYYNCQFKEPCLDVFHSYINSVKMLLSLGCSGTKPLSCVASGLCPHESWGEPLCSRGAPNTIPHAAGPTPLQAAQATSRSPANAGLGAFEGATGSRGGDLHLLPEFLFLGETMGLLPGASVFGGVLPTLSLFEVS